MNPTVNNLLYLVVPTALMVLVLWFVLLRPTKSSKAVPTAERVSAADAAAAPPAPTAASARADRVPVPESVGRHRESLVAVASTVSTANGGAPSTPRPEISARLRRADATIAELRDRLARAEAEVSQRDTLLAHAAAQMAAPAIASLDDDRRSAADVGADVQAAEAAEVLVVDDISIDDDVVVADDDLATVAEAMFDSGSPPWADDAIDLLDRDDRDHHDGDDPGVDFEPEGADQPEEIVVDVAAAEQQSDLLDRIGALEARVADAELEPTTLVGTAGGDVIDLSGAESAGATESSPRPVAVDTLPDDVEALVPLFGQVGAAVQRTLAERDARIDELTGELTRLSDARQAITADLEHLRTSVADASDDLASTRTQAEQAAGELAAAEARLADLGSERDRALDAADGARDRAGLLADQLDEARARSEAADAAVVAAETRIGELETTVGSAQRELARAEEAIEAGRVERKRLRSELKSSQSRISELETERDELTARIESLHDRDLSVLNELVEARDRLSSIEARIDSITSTSNRS